MPENLPATSDPNSPYYINPSENSSLPIVSEKFNGEGYGEWKRSMLIALATKNKLGFIDGTLVKPSVTDPTYSAWQRCDAIIISYILRSLENSIARSVIFLGTSSEIWKDLEERFSQTSGPQLYTLQQALADLKQGSDISITEFFTQIKAIWEQINQMNPLPVCISAGCTCTQIFLKQQQEERLVQLLMKLDNKFSTVRSSILMMQPLPSISLAYKLLIQEEKQRQASLVDEEQSGRVMAFAADYKKSFKQQGYGPKMTFQGGNGGNKLTITGKRSGAVICDHCKIPGHTMDKCYKLHGYPPSFGNRAKGRKYAAIAQNEGDGDSVGDQNSLVTHLSMEQYNTLIKVLQSQEVDTHTESQVHVAGSSIDTLSGSW
ncbi:uncharacterized protein [Spinacia oleracea]|uniref:Retrotransposon Copia-like N-terminal domain-containing protein n=1 Tax=Spinacia oleracea TaxID=3562 RepID=A0A9R0J974_SPIOL|nr:uncharacterized protein LOC110801286 [Spinacia oleracea]